MRIMVPPDNNMRSPAIPRIAISYRSQMTLGLFQRPSPFTHELLNPMRQMLFHLFDRSSFALDVSCGVFLCLEERLRTE